MLKLGVYEKTLNTLREEPELLELLENIIEIEKEHRDDPVWLGVEWHNVGASPQILKKLVFKGVLKVTYSSRSSTSYRLKDFGEVKRAVETFKALPETSPVCEEVEIPSDLFDIIIGYDDIKKWFMKSLYSEKPVHILLVGKPATAKSLMIMCLMRLPNSRYATGSSVSKAGVYDYLLEYRPRYIILDEIDKMHSADYDALLSVMETGIVTRLKHGMKETAQLKLWVFAAANRVDRIPEELRSRFLFGGFFLPEYTEEEFKRVVVHVLTKREGTTEDLASYIAERLSKTTKDVRNAVQCARLCKTREEVDSLIFTWQKYR